MRGVTAAWAEAGRAGRPQILTGRYFDCGPDAATTLPEYLAHYYGAEGAAAAMADAIDSDERLRHELELPRPGAPARRGAGAGRRPPRPDLHLHRDGRAPVRSVLAVEARGIPVSAAR